MKKSLLPEMSLRTFPVRSHKSPRGVCLAPYLLLRLPLFVVVRSCQRVGFGRGSHRDSFLVPQKTWVRKSNIRVDCYVLTERKLKGQNVQDGQFVHPKVRFLKLIVMRQFVPDVKH